jgi:Tol biopolymer transport system component
VIDNTRSNLSLGRTHRALLVEEYSMQRATRILRLLTALLLGAAGGSYGFGAPPGESGAAETAAAAAVRTWRDTSGRTLEATLVEVQADKVVLRGAQDEKLRTVPLDKLSAADRKFIEQTRKIPQPGDASSKQEDASRPGIVPANIRITELGALPEASHRIAMTMSLDGRNVAWVEKRGGKQVVVRDGQAQTEYDLVDVKSLTFGPDNRRLAYAALEGKRIVFVVDGKVLAETGGVEKVMFSPDGKSVALVSNNRATRKECVVVDGIAQGEFDNIYSGYMRYSPVGNRLAYVATQARKYCLVVDGKAGPQFDNVDPGSVVFSPDGKRVAYVAKTGKKQFAVIDGKADAEHDEIYSRIQLSSDGKSAAYGARNGETRMTVFSGLVQPEGAQSVVFSPDGKRKAFVVKRDKKLFMNVDGKIGPEYDNLYMRETFFSPDGKRWAYVAIQGQAYCLVVDGNSGPAFQLIQGSTVKISPNSAHYAYVGQIRGKQVVVVDETAGPEYLDVQQGIRMGIGGIVYDWFSSEPIFSPDGNRVGYVAKKSARSFVFVVDGREGEEYDDICAAGFSPDSKHVAYVAIKGGKKFVVLDGKLQASVEAMLEDGDVNKLRFYHLAFDADGTLEYLGAAKGALQRVQISTAK